MHPDVFERLVNLRQQQENSIESIERLRDEHKSWQKSFDDLLASINTDLPTPDVSREEDAPRVKLTSIAPPVGDTESIPSDAPDREMSPSSLNVLPKHPKRNASGPLHRIVKQGLAEVESQASINATLKPRIIREWQAQIKRTVYSSSFEYVTGSVIFINLFTIGIEAQMSLLKGQEFGPWSWAWVVERIFLSIYCGELFLRGLAGASLLEDLWFFLDTCLVIVGVFALVILPLTVGEIADIGAEKFLLVRGIRLLRLVRALRMFKHFKVMWRLVNGLLTAGKTLLSTAVLILVSLFVFSCIAVELIAKDEALTRDESTAAIVEKYFWGVDISMVTLMQFVTLDSAASIYFPIIMRRPWLSLYFLLIVFVISIGLMNLVTAVVLENAMESAAEEAEEERSSLKSKVKEAIPELVHIFEHLDKDKSGILTRDEMESVDDNLLPRRLLDSACVASMLDFFDFLDIEEKQELTQQEFVEGLLNLCLLEMPISAIQTLKLLQMVLTLSKKIDQNVEALRAMESVHQHVGVVPPASPAGESAIPH